MTFRRGVGFVFALIGLALVVSVAALVVLYVCGRRRSGAARAVPSAAALVLRPGGELPELRVRRRGGPVRRSAATTACGRSSSALRRAKPDPRITSVVLIPGSLDSPYWAKLQELRDAVLDFRRRASP